jgi:hypothetical protein
LRFGGYGGFLLGGFYAAGQGGTLGAVGSSPIGGGLVSGGHASRLFALIVGALTDGVAYARTSGATYYAAHSAVALINNSAGRRAANTTNYGSFSLRAPRLFSLGLSNAAERQSEQQNQGGDITELFHDLSL